LTDCRCDYQVAAVLLYTPRVEVARSTYNPALTVFAVVTAVSTLFLICVGGLVTSHGAGMAVPDWPTTYGYNMFAFPFSQWLFTGNGIFYEHSHRLVASAVGFLTTVLAVWLWLKDERRWLRWLGVVAFLLVCVQGLLGGLRVTLYKDELGIFHATLAQVFFLLVSAIAFCLTKTWRRLVAARHSVDFHRRFRPALLAASILILLQLVLGATMRHQHAGLAVPDFPLAYGKIWPPTDAAFLEEANRKRHDHRDFHPVTAAHVHLHMAHRITACAILLLVAGCAVLSRKGARNVAVIRLTDAWLTLILIQATLGAYTVWSNKAADIATAHVAVGAISLVLGALIYLGTAPLAASAVLREPLTESLPQGTPVLS
jgi:cytochrome c oxidase assembly protein subunit 15